MPINREEGTGDKGPGGRDYTSLTSPWHSWSPPHKHVYSPQNPSSFKTHTPCCPSTTSTLLPVPFIQDLFTPIPTTTLLLPRCHLLGGIPALAKGLKCLNSCDPSVCHSVLRGSDWSVPVTEQTRERRQGKQGKSGSAGEPQWRRRQIGYQADKDRASDIMI